jgi:multidrug efflux pump subunit AcrA (membrane-fusion protein)
VLDLPATGESRVELPLSAIGEDAGGRFVWVVEGDSPMVRKIAIETGELTGNGLVVTGVEPGAKVVTAGLSKLFEGRRVRLEQL